MNVEHLAFFLRLSETEGLAKAGREFGFSAATSSAKLSALEAYFGCRLVNRTTRSFSLTEEGRLLYDRAKGIVSDVHDLKNRLSYGSENISGRIRMTCTHDFGRHVLSPILNKFMNENPDISIELLMNDSHLDVIGEGIDMAIRMGNLQDSTLRVRQIAKNRRVVCASPDYLERYGEPKHPLDLKDHNCLGIMFKYGVNQDWQFFENGKTVSVRVSGNRICNNGEMVRDWCVGGHGIAFKSIWDVRNDLSAGRLVELLKPYRNAPESALNVVYPGGVSPSPRVKALTDFMAISLRSP